MRCGNTGHRSSLEALSCNCVEAAWQYCSFKQCCSNLRILVLDGIVMANVIHMLIDKIKLTWRGLWCNGYHHRKWTRRNEFKSWTRLIAFHIALIPLGKVWVQLFSLQLWVNSRADWFFSLGEATSLGERKLWIQTC